MTPWRIEPNAFWHVGHLLNQLCHCVPPSLTSTAAITYTQQTTLIYYYYYVPMNMY